MRVGIAAVLFAIVCLGIYWPHKDVQFVLDDYYTVVRNPLIKNPVLYKNIWTSRLFDAHPSSGYIKFGYYRPVLESSWIVDYRLFGLKASGFQWINLFIHALNCFFVYLLCWQLFAQGPLALKTSLLFAVLPTQEWVVRYVTGRGDELSALFALFALITLAGIVKNGFKQGYFLVLACWILSALTREVAVSYILYAFLIYSFYRREQIKRFSLYWVLIGLLPLIAIGSIIPKQGNILCWHIFYFASIGLCLWFAQLRLRVFVVLFILFSAISCYQGQFWATEERLLRHTRGLEWWPRTSTAQQLLMKYDDNIPAIEDMADHSQDPLIKAMWLRRLGVVYFTHADLSHAQEYFLEALKLNPSDVDSLDALAVVYHNQGREKESLDILNQALTINPNYPDTLRTLGIHYFINKDYAKAQQFLNRCLIFAPDNAQARTLLDLAIKMK